jgi:hypothetical protein
VRRYFANGYQAQNWKNPRRVVAKAEDIPHFLAIQRES